MLLLQNILYCLLFILMVKCLVRNDGNIGVQGVQTR